MYMRVVFSALFYFGGFTMYRTLRPSSAARSSLLQSGLQTKKTCFQFCRLSSYLNGMAEGSYCWGYQCRYFWFSLSYSIVFLFLSLIQSVHSVGIYGVSLQLLDHGDRRFWRGRPGASLKLGRGIWRLVTF
ncbi:hypothetical protein F4809DRAFT_590790, partial [Biscogniauxia mediterranea]